MLKRLRIQFIALTMATIGIVLTLVSVAICTFDYQRSLSDVYRALETAMSNRTARNRPKTTKAEIRPTKIGLARRRPTSQTPRTPPSEASTKQAATGSFPLPSTP